MSANTILVVEDNPITRKVLRLTLESEGYNVLEAGDAAGAVEAVVGAAPDLVLLDYVLPDSDGLTLLGELRRRCRLPELPALLITGMVSRLDELRDRAGAAVHVLIKPVEPTALIELVRAHLAAPGGEGGGRLVLVVDDEPLTLKLSALRLGQAGYEVTAAAGAEECLAKARAQPPAAILSDVLMPGMDGFALCLEVRRDPRLAAVPVVLTSSAYVEEADRELARSVGADALVLRSPDMAEAIAALGRILAAPAAPPLPPAPSAQVSGLHRDRLLVQLERERTRNEALLRQTAIQATALSVIRGLSQALADPRAAPRAVSDVLVHCLDAAGLSTGLMYLCRADGGLVLGAQFGVATGRRTAADSCFGQAALLQEVMAACEPMALSRELPPGSPPAEMLRGIGLASALLVPFVVLGKSFGVLVLASDNHELGDNAWIGFARSLAAQFGQTVALGQSLEHLAASESRHRAVMEQAHDAILILDLPYRILEANRQAERLLGRPRDQLVGRLYDDFVVDEERADTVACRLALLANGSMRIDERHLLRPDRTRVEVEVSAALVRVSETGEPIFVSILRDISERRRLEAQLRQAQKMESLGRLAGGVAHDFNNMLGVINGYAELLLDRRPDDEHLRTFAGEILKAGQRAAGLTRQLLAFSRRQILEPRILSLNRVVVEVERMLRRVIGEDVALVTDLAEGLPMVEADPGQLEQVLLNLVVNARDAMPRGGRITLTTGLVEVDGEPAAHPCLGLGRYVQLSVRDTGHGIPPEVRAHLFEPFFTSKEPGKGTGLGLATVLGIVEQSGGHVHAVKGLELGACFEVFLPAAEARDEPAPSPAPPQPARGSEAVLLVEDEPSLRALVRQLLTASGYTVLEAADAAAALELGAAHRGTIDLLLTDVVLPGRSGTELASELLALRPEIKVLYMSGYTDDTVVLRGLLSGSTVLQKPFDAATLGRKVRETLGQRPTDDAAGG